MAIEQKNILTVWAENSTYYNEPSETEIGDADNILPNKSIDAEPVNGALRIAFLAIQYLQRTGGLYNSTTPYLPAQSCTLIRKVDSEYHISEFVCIASTTGNAPLTGSTITTLNGVSVYTNGTVNSGYWKLSEPVNNSITNAMLATMAANTIKGVTTAGTPADLTATQVTAMLNAATTSLQGMLSASDKTKLNAYPTPGTNWDLALAYNLGNYIPCKTMTNSHTDSTAPILLLYKDPYEGTATAYKECRGVINLKRGSESSYLINTSIKLNISTGYTYNYAFWDTTGTSAIGFIHFNIGICTYNSERWICLYGASSPAIITGVYFSGWCSESTGPILVSPSSISDYTQDTNITKVNNYSNGNNLIYNKSTVATNWPAALITELKTNSASLLSTGINSDWLSIVITDIANSITNAMLATMAANTIKGVTTAGTPADLTATQVTAMLNAATTSLQGMLSASDKTKLNAYPTPGTNWYNALNSTLKSNMSKALLNLIGFGNTFGENTLISSGNVITDLLHCGDLGIFDSSSTNIPNSDSAWYVVLIHVGTTSSNPISSKYIALSTSGYFYTGNASSSTEITWTNVFNEVSVGSGQSILLQEDYYVINSSSSFQTLCDATSGSYPRVKVLSGTWTSTTPLNLTTTGIKEIVGEDGAVLNFNTTSGSILITGSSTEEIKNISITESSTVSTVSIIYAIKKIEDVILTVNTVNGIRYGFNSCGSIISARTVLGGGSTSYNLYLFHACKRLSNIYISSSSDILTDGLYLFHESTDINNVTINLTAGFDNLYCFYDSNNVRNIDINLTSVSGSIAYVSYYNCENLSGIKCTFTGAGKFLGFSDNYNLSDITLDINSTYSTAEALKVFNLCENISNVKFIDFDVDYTTLYVFYYCKNISGIYINVMDVTTSATLYIFRSCHNINNIYSEATIVGDDIRFFYLSDTISNAYLNMSGSASTDFYCFYACEYISNCHINLTLSSGVLIGINDGALINNCSFVLSGLGTGSGSDIAGMLGTNFISDCVLNIAASSGNISYVYGFSNCTQVRGCKVIMDDDTFYAFSGCHGLMGNWASVGVFNASYSTIDSTGIAENTGGGGLNYTS